MKVELTFRKEIEGGYEVEEHEDFEIDNLKGIWYEHNEGCYPRVVFTSLDGYTWIFYVHHILTMLVEERFNEVMERLEGWLPEGSLKLET